MSGSNDEASATTITADVGTLTRVRPGGIRERLRPLTGLTLGVDTKGRYRTFAIAVKYGTPASDNVRDWTFPSIADDIRCHYLEQWRTLGDDEETWELERVHFHLLHEGPLNHGRGEIVLFHWQPSAGGDDDMLSYSRRPHLHVNSRDVPLNKAHLAVNLAPAKGVPGSMEYLDDLLDEVATMLKVEVVERIGSIA